MLVRLQQMLEDGELDDDDAPKRIGQHDAPWTRTGVDDSSSGDGEHRRSDVADQQ
jgi:hypothetical protein